jgi:hypothetical protein
MSSTVAQLRTYTIHDGMMDSWLALFDTELVPRMREAGIGVHSRWVDPDRARFIWIRVFGDSDAEIEAKEKAFYGSEWWLANVDHVRSHIAAREVMVLHAV